LSESEISFGAGVVDGVDVDRLEAVPATGDAAGEREHERTVVLVDEDPVDPLVTLELVRIVAVGAAGAGAQPDRVCPALAQGITVGGRFGVDERVVRFLLW